MYRLVVLCFTLFAVAVVRPSPIYTHLPPAAISHQSRLDIIESKPTLSVIYEAPIHAHQLHVPYVQTLENFEETHEIPILLSNPVVENSFVPENHEELLHEYDDVSLHGIHQTHDGPVIVTLSDSIVHNSEEIHPILSSNDHEEHLPEYGVQEIGIHQTVHETPVVLTDGIEHNSEEIHPILSSSIHEEHFPEHEVQQISVSSHSIHQTHDSPASTVHAIPIVLSDSNLHGSEGILSLVSSENVEKPAINFLSSSLVHL